MKFFKVKSIAETEAVIDRLAAAYKLQTEVVPVLEARGRVAAKAVTASFDVPTFDRSTVDGYAVISSDTHGATDAIPALMDMTGTIEMGVEVTQGIGRSQTMYVPTGGMLPPGADGVVMIEDSEKLDDATVGLMRSIAAYDNVIRRGDDIKTGTVIMEAGRQISALDIGALAAQGISQVTVLRRPVVTILSTGDEIIEPGQPASMGQIYDINSYVLQNLLQEAGCVVAERRIVRDDYDELYNAVRSGAEVSDIVLLSGGSSVGTRDYTYDVISNLPDSCVEVQGVAIKPGKPTIVGKGAGKLIVGLPGHPVSSIMVFKVFVERYIRRLLGQAMRTVGFEGALTENVHAAPGRTTYQMVRVEQPEEAVIDDQADTSAMGDRSQPVKRLVPIHGKSGMISLLTGAEGYIIIDLHQEGYDKGSRVEGYWL